MTVLVEPLQTVDDVFDLGKREYAARAGEAYQLDVGQDLFAVLVADARYRTALHTAYARAEVEGCGQCSGGVLLLRDMLAEFHGVQVSAQDAGRSHDGNAFRIENFLLDERSVFLHYPQIYEQYPYSAKVAVKTPKRKRPPVLDGEGNEVPKGLPKLRGLNTVADMLTRFRAFILWAIDNGHTTNNPFKHFTIGEIVYGTPIYITNEERTQLLEADLSGNKEVETQRDIFIFHCFIGCRVSDLFKMTYRNIIGDAIEYIQRKTKEDRPVTVRVPLSKTAVALIDKYREEGRESLFPFSTEQHYNRKIKEAFRLAGLNRTVTVLDQRTRQEVQKPIYEVTSSHMARRTFIGNIYKKVKDPNMVGALSGHKEGSRAFARYRNIDDDMKKEMIGYLD